MMNNQKESCPLCKGSVLVWGDLRVTSMAQTGNLYFKPHKSDRFFRPELDVDGLVCSDCGHVVRLKVRKPEKLKPKNN